MTDSQCFHCDLPVTETHPPTLKVLDKQRFFCCHGCKAVCNAIVQSGNEEYYHYRESSGKTFDPDVLTGLLDQLKLYDKPEIQRDFVRTDKNGKEAWLILEEIRCAACMWLNERTLRQLDGVLDVQVDYTGQQVRVRWNPEVIQLSAILTAITQIGYVAHPFDPQYREALNKEQEQRSIKRIIFALILGMMVMQTAIGSYFFGTANETGEFPLWITLSRWTSLVVTAFILAYPGQLFFKNAWRDIKNKTLGMDVPIALGLLVAWSGSLLSTIRGTGEVYYESIAMFVLLMLIARYVELRARVSATALLDRASKIIPASVQKINKNNVLEEVAVIELQPGDRVQLSPGETVPVDALLLSDQSSFDESLLSGEALPVKHIKGDPILGGSINIEQPIELKVLKNSNHSLLSKIQQLTQQSVNDKPYYVDLAESVAGKFVAIILLIALLTGLYWYWIDAQQAVGHIVAVLIVTCPCALALASPVALSLCAAGLSKLHMMTLRMSAIEEISHIDTVVFDKTGTLTQGKPHLETLITVGNYLEENCLSIAAAMEQNSEHPFAKALLTAASDLPLPELEKRVNHPGEGIEASFRVIPTASGCFVPRHELWRLGCADFIGSMTENVTYTSQARQLRQQGLSLLYLCNEEGIQALFGISDPLREGVRDYISQIVATNRRVVLSGDHPQSVQAVGESVGVSEVYGGLSPQEKLAWIQQQQQQGRRILMMGDGINDAPTLAAANVSMSFSDATDLAQSHSDLVVLRQDFTQLSDAMQLMKKTRKIILQNLSWAVVYNVLAIPAAAMGFVTPWMAAIGMSLSSFVVVMNSLRLRRALAS